MSYTPINWQTGQTITAEKLNKMDNGWGVESTTFFSETVESEETEDGNFAEFSNATFINAETVVITFDGTDYVCTNISENEDEHLYGAPWSDTLGGYDFSTYPFQLRSLLPPIPMLPGGNEMFTQTSGTHTVSVNAELIETTEDFNNAVNNVVNHKILKIKNGITTWQEVYDAMLSGKLVYWIEELTNGIELYLVSLIDIPSAGVYSVGAVRYAPSGVIFGQLTATSADGVLLHSN